MIEYKTTINAQGDINLPPEVREAAHLGESDLLAIEVTPEGILLRPVKEEAPEQEGEIFYSEAEFLAALDRWDEEDADI
jgi:AbrB family looped-hinge helix DNA binding protein